MVANHEAALAAVEAAARRVLAEEGPLGHDELSDRLVGSGIADARAVEQALDELNEVGDALVGLPGDRYADLPTLLEGVTFTHRLTVAEHEAGVLLFEPDLAALAGLDEVDGGPVLGDGNVLRHAHLDSFDDDAVGPDDQDSSSDCGWEGPPGWLEGFAPGDLMTLRVSRGRLELGRLDVPPAAPVGLGERLHDLFAELNEGDGYPVYLAELLLAAIDDMPDAFRGPLPPAGELLGAAGFEIRGEWVAPVGTDWDGHDQMRDAVRLVLAHDLDPEGFGVLRAALHAHRALAAGDPVPSAVLADIAAGLAGDDDVVEAFWEEAGGPGGDGGSVGTFAGRLLAASTGRARAAPLWLLARSAESEGRTLEAERLTHQALEADPRFAPAIEDAAWYASDRGDARQAVSLLHRARDAHDGELAFLRAMARPARAKVGRNEPCPCGSGRKYKQCHLGREELPLADRAHWLLEKGRTYLHRGPGRELLLALATAIAGDDEPSADAVHEAIHNPVVADLALFEDGWWERFLADRGPLLPPDERDLAVRWAGARSSVYRVVEVRAGEGVGVVDLDSRERVFVRERTFSREARVDDLVWARVLPDGTGHQFSGALVRVTLRMRDDLLELLDAKPSGLALAAFFGAASRPPRLANTDGEDLVFCEARYRLRDVDGARAALDERLDRDGDEDTWHQWYEATGQRWIRASATIDGDELVIGANSLARFDRIGSLLADVLADAEPVSEERTPAARALASHRAQAGAGAAPPAAPEGRELRRALEEFIRDQERRWLDQPVPALRGLTPREAAADPDRRDDLVLLLHEMDRGNGDAAAGGFSAARLRALLGLT
jgi:hypothetical protein